MYTIGQLMEQTLFSRDTLNWYIRLGLITHTSRVGLYRVFDDTALGRLETIKALRAPSTEHPKGMSLEAIKAVLDGHGNGQ